jgi:hypothetical protein
MQIKINKNAKEYILNKTKDIVVKGEMCKS